MANGTGTGGFDIDGKLQTYDVGVVKEEESSTPYDRGTIRVDSRPKDLSNGTKKTLASYLSKMTLAREGPQALPRQSNAYPIDADLGPPATLLDPYGNTSPLPTGGPNTNRFAKDGPALRSRSDDAVQLDATFRRGLAAASGPNPEDGHNLFQDIAVPPGGAGSLLDSTVVLTGDADFGAGSEPFSLDAKKTQLNEKVAAGAYTKSLLSRNRFVAGQDRYVASSPGKLTIEDQINPQQFVRGYKPGSSKVPSDAQRVSFGQLAQVGTNLMVRTTKELGSLGDGYSPASSKAEANAILPTLQQIGVERIETELLEGRSVFESLPFAPIKSEQVTNFSKLSWGALNSALDQYGGVSNFGMQLLAVSLVTGAIVAIDVLGLIFGLMPTTAVVSDQNGKNIAPRDPLGRLPIGSSVANSTPIDTNSIGGLVKSLLSGNLAITSLFGIRPTHNKFSTCVSRGALAFFGLDGTSISDVLKNALSLSQHPGYVTAMARAFSRSFLRIADSLKSLVDAFGVGLTSGIKQLLGFVDFFRQSRFIGTINLFASLGDSIITEFDSKFLDTVATTGFGEKVSKIDAYPNSPGGAHVKNRLRGISTPTTAWSTGTAKDMLIKPQSYSTYDYIDRPKIDLSIVESSDKRNVFDNPYLSSSDNRFSDQLRESMEEELESEYLPFYISDLRTNEIVSFHAFLASLTDGYTASYDSTDAIGRVEAVKIYKNTSRKVDFSFYMAAMSDVDFDYMWTKINKLTTLVYPQYSAGKEITSTQNGRSYRVSVPFSQVMSAAPMVRVRIGDLITSNYSKFNLARLFGYKNPTASFGSEDDSSKKKAEEERSSAEQRKLQEQALLMNPILNKTYHLSDELNQTAFKGGKSDSYVYSIKGPFPSGLLLKVVDVGENGVGVVAEVIVNPSLDAGISGATLVNLYGNRSNEKQNIIGKKFVFNSGRLRPTGDTIAYIKSEIKKKEGASAAAAAAAGGSSGSSDVVRTAAQFIDEKNNPVTKSFKSVGGRGLAGFIESLNFEWFDRTPWNVNATASNDLKGRRTPMMCKVSVAFSPIHDISPGIDHHGFNRAPIYPVGPLSNR